MSYQTNRNQKNYNIRIQICEKCSQHYIGVLTNNYFKLRHFKHNDKRQTVDFIAQEQQYCDYYESFVNMLNQLAYSYDGNKKSLNNKQSLQKYAYQPKLQRNMSNNSQLAIIANEVGLSLNIKRNQCYKYLSSLPASHLSSKRYLNLSTNKIIQYPRRDSFQIYFQNLLVFSKLSSKQWPNLSIVAKIISRLIDYSEENCLMQNLSKFIHHQIQFQSFQAKHLSLYQYLHLISSTSQDNQQQTQQIINNLNIIIRGQCQIVQFNHQQAQILQINQCIHKKDVIPYTNLNSKAKKGALSSIYLTKDTKTQRKQKKLVNSAFSQRNLTITKKKLKKGRPISSHYGSPNKFNQTLKIKPKNQVFSLIKMGNFEQQIINQQFNNFTNSYVNQNIDKQIKNLCSTGITSKKGTKCVNKNQQSKLFLNSKFSIHKNNQKKQLKQNQIEQNEDKSIIWNEITKKTSFTGRRSSKNTSINTFIRQQQPPMYKLKLNSKQNISSIKYFHQSSKIIQQVLNESVKKLANSRTKRSSYFLNENQQNKLRNDVTQLSKIPQVSNKLKKSRRSSIDFFNQVQPQLRSSKKKIFKNSSQQSQQQQLTYPNLTPLSRKEQNLSQSQDSDNDEVKQKYKLNVIRKSRQSKQKKLVQKRQENSITQILSIKKLSKYNKMSESSIKNNKISEPSIKNNQTDQARRQQQIDKKRKLSVKSRRKSSFYYSNQNQNNPITEMFLQNNKKQQSKQKRTHSKRQSFSKVKLITTTYQTGVQVNFSTDTVNSILDHQIHKYDQNKSTQQKDDPFCYNQLNRRSNTHSNIQNDNHQINRYSLEERQHIFSNRYVSTQAQMNMTGGLKYIPLAKKLVKQKFQAPINTRIFPCNRFSHAFIVQKFSQVQNYQLDIKRIFTTNNKQREKQQKFQFPLKCEQKYRKIIVQSLNIRYDFCQQKITLKLFPDVFKQIQKYSTPLVEVVNRLMKFHPLMLNRIFTNSHGVSPIGQYCLWIYSQDTHHWKPIFVNDLVPFYQNQNLELFPVYAQKTNQNSIWFIILEKVMAKVYGGYHKLEQAKIGDLFSMLTGCPRVNVQSFTVNKLRKIFSDKVFLNKKAYVFALNSSSPPDLRIDRIMGLKLNQQTPRKSLTIVQQVQGCPCQLSLQKLILLYSQISLIFLKHSFMFNQLCLPIIQCSFQSTQLNSSLMSFYIFNQKTNEVNDIYISLGGFNPVKKSRIIVFLENQTLNNMELAQLQITDPLKYYQTKYVYVGEITKNGNFFFQTTIQYGKYLCLIQSQFQSDHQYYVSTYSASALMFSDVKHNPIEVHDEFSNPLQKIFHKNKMMRQNKLLKNKKNLDSQYQIPSKVFINEIESASQVEKKNDLLLQKAKSRSKGASAHQRILKSKKFIQDQWQINQRKQSFVKDIISNVQKSQDQMNRKNIQGQFKQGNNKSVMKMINNIQQNAENLRKKQEKIQQELKNYQKDNTQQLLFEEKPFKINVNSVSIKKIK